jgi:hypothetical protein
MLLRQSTHYAANWKARTPKEPEIAELAENFRSDLQTGLAARVVPAKTLTAFPLNNAISNFQHDIPVDITKKQKEGRFTLLRLVLHADTVEGEDLKYLGFRLGIPADLGAITWSMWPTTKLRLVATAGTTLQVALNSNFGFEIPDVPVHPGIPIGAELKADVAGNFLLIWDWRRYRADIVATGQQDSFADWRLKKPRDVVGDVEFMWLLFSPKGVDEISVSLRGIYKIKPSFFRKTVSVGLRRARPYRVSIPT